MARTFAREGAKVILAGRTRETLDTVAKDIAADGGSAEVRVVDATDEQAVDDKRLRDGGVPRVRQSGGPHRDDGECDLWARAQVTWPNDHRKEAASWISSSNSC